MSWDADQGGRRPLLLLLEEGQAASAVRALGEIGAGAAVELLEPPIRGVGFFAAEGDDGARLDAWWESVGSSARPLVLVAHEEGLPHWIPGLDADFLVAVHDPQARALYRGLDNVHCCSGEDPRILAEAALQEGLLPAPPPPPDPPPDPFGLLSAAHQVPPPQLWVRPADSDPPPPLNRRELLGPPAASSGPRPRSRPLLRHLLPLPRGGRRRVDEQLGRSVLAVKPLVVAVVSRKGGVGKTASAAAIGAILGEALDAFGHTAALVDANIGNPDAWGRLEIRGTSATVRETIALLAAGREPRSPAWSQTPALAVYPESRAAGDGYTPAEIQRLATYLRLRHAAIVVDLPNRLPAFSSAEASIAASWIEEANVVVLPATADPTALLGTVEYLSAESVARRPVVVPYIVPRLREIRRAPQVLQMLDRIRDTGAAVVEVPDDDRATLALIRQTAITEAGGELRQAYLELAAKVVGAAPGRRTR